jgi:hypothetical protein
LRGEKGALGWWWAGDQGEVAPLASKVGGGNPIESQGFPSLLATCGVAKGGSAGLVGERDTARWDGGWRASKGAVGWHVRKGRLLGRLGPRLSRARAGQAACGGLGVRLGRLVACRAAWWATTARSVPDCAAAPSTAAAPAGHGGAALLGRPCANVGGASGLRDRPLLLPPSRVPCTPPRSTASAGARPCIRSGCGRSGRLCGVDGCLPEARIGPRCAT